MEKFRIPLLILLAGAILTACGVIYFKSDIFSPQTKVEVLNATTSGQVNGGDITAEIAGEVTKPGVYKLPAGSRVDDLLIIAGGFSKNADRSWTDKYLNRAAKLTDGQKIFIPNYQSNTLGAKTEGGDQTISPSISSDSNTLVNINTASLKRLIDLPEIAQTRAQSIIDHRYYSTLEELVSKGVLTKSVYEKIKTMISVY